MSDAGVEQMMGFDLRALRELNLARTNVTEECLQMIATGFYKTLLIASSFFFSFFLTLFLSTRQMKVYQLFRPSVSKVPK